jgi:hypothetical protein
VLVPCKMQEVLAAGEKLTDAWTSRGALWGAAVDAGAVLHVKLHVRADKCMRLHDWHLSLKGQLVTDLDGRGCVQASNSTFQSRYLEVSVSCHDGSHLGSYERGFDSSAVLATGHVTGAQERICCAVHAQTSAMCKGKHRLKCCLSCRRAVSAGAGRRGVQQVCGHISVSRHLLPVSH